MTAHLDHASTLISGVRPCGLSEADLDVIAWGFLRSQFTSLIYANWPIERRVDAYLAHHDMGRLLNNGDALAAVLQRVLANIGVALRNGILPTRTWETSRRQPRTTKQPSEHQPRVTGTRFAPVSIGNAAATQTARGEPICVAGGASRTAMRMTSMGD